MRRAQGIDLEQTFFGDQQREQTEVQGVEVSREQMLLTQEQLGRLDKAHWSEWQVDFGHHPGCAIAGKPLESSRSKREESTSSRSKESGSEHSRSSSESSPSTALRSATRPSSSLADAGQQSHDKLGSEVAQEIIHGEMLEARAVASTASGTPMDKGLNDNMSLEALNSRLTSMQQATQALAK